MSFFCFFVKIAESEFKNAESCTKFAESFVKLYPPPLSPSAREGESLLDSALLYIFPLAFIFFLIS
ncbi:hypothetical protein [Helicobacter sp. 23-1045]